jgi:hypothetical protein
MMNFDSQQKDSTETLTRLIQEEWEAIESYKSKAMGIADPYLQSLLRTLADLRARSVAELESRMNELKSQKEITTQINAMFW